MPCFFLLGKMHFLLFREYLNGLEMKVISAIFPDSGKIKWAASEFEFKYLGLYLTQTTNHIFY